MTTSMDDRIAKTEEIGRRITAGYIGELEKKVEWLEAYNEKYGEQPQEGDTDEVTWLRRLLGEARGQRDATQRALDKANRDNDGLRAELRALGREEPESEIAEAPRSWTLEKSTEIRVRFDGNDVAFVADPEFLDTAFAGTRTIKSTDGNYMLGRSLGEKEVKALVDGGAGYFVEDEEE